MLPVRQMALRVYPHLPIVAQNVLCTLEGWRRKRWRYGGRQPEWEAFFRESATWSEERLRDFQDERLRVLVAHAATRVPYYRERFRQIGLNPKDIRGVQDISSLPVLTREDLRHHWKDLIAENWPKSHLWLHPSGGSTGMPITIVTSREAMEMEYGFYWARRRPGVTRRDPFANFSANPIVPSSQTRPPFWRDNWASRQRLYSVFHLSDANIPSYVEDLNRRPCAYIQGYPSAVYTLAEWVLRTGYHFTNPIRAFFSTSEVLQPAWRQAIEQAFHVRVWDQWGQGEAAGSITEYECGHLHVDEDYGILELWPVGEEDGLVRAEVVCTSLHNLAWPLIRYRVGDLVLYDPDEKCAAGRPGRIIRRIEGRTSQYFTLPDGRRITSLMGLSIHCRNTRSIQVIQERPSAIRIHVVPAPEFTQADREHMLRVFRSRLGEEVQIEVVLADRPVLTQAGKFLAIINCVASDPGSLP